MDSKLLKNILRAIATVCAVFFFIPVFTVSCAGEDLNVSGLNAATGFNGDIDPNVMAYLLLLVPIAALVVLCIKGLSDKAGLISLVLNVAYIIVLVIFCVQTKSQAEDLYCEFSIKFTYFINVLLAVAGAFGSFMLMKDKPVPTYYDSFGGPTY